MALRRALPLHQAGGGTLAEAGSSRKLGSLSPHILGHLKGIYQSISAGDKALDRKEAAVFLDDVQHAHHAAGLEALPNKDQIDFNDFLAYASSSAFDALASPKTEDASHCLSDYFISSSHNTYLTGHQLYGDASVDGYTNVLLRGCRCIEIDVWDGESKSSEEAQNDEATATTTAAGDTIKPWQSYETTSRAEPRVLHGYTLTKEVSFRKVCHAIKDAAFKSSDLPVVVSVELHVSLQQQQVMLDIMREIWNEHLAELPPDAETCALPSVDSLRNKILIKIKYVPPKKEETTAEPPTVVASNVSSSSSSAEEDNSAAARKEKKAKKKKVSILPELSRLGIYTRACHFSSFSQPEASIPTHVFSLSEKKFHDMLEKYPTGLFEHNRRFLMRAYPKGMRVSSSNYDPSPFWRQGVQMVALNWQRPDAGMMLNEAMFAGEGGWVLKPPSFLSTTTPTPASVAPARLLDLSITFYAAQDLPLPPNETKERSFRPYIKLELHSYGASLQGKALVSRPSTHHSSSAATATDYLASSSNTPRVHSSSITRSTPSPDPGSNTKLKLKTRTRSSREPDFGAERLEFLGVRTSTPAALSFVRFKIMDDVLGKDELAGWACVRLDRLRQGFRFLRVYDAKGNVSDGMVLVKIEVTWR